MTYQITALFQGTLLRTFDGVEAKNALEAIDRIEKEFFPPKIPFQLSGKGDDWLTGHWSGVEFQAREFKMFMS